MIQADQEHSGQVFDPVGLRESHRSMSTSELLAIVSIDAGDYIEDALGIARDELRARGLGDSQIEERVRSFKARRYDQRRSAEVLRDEAEMLDIARVQLRENGADVSQFDEQICDLEAARYDAGPSDGDLRTAEARNDKALSRWIFWLCLLDPGALTFIFVVLFISMGRNRFVAEVLRAWAYGWALKLGIFVLVKLAILIYAMAS